MKKLNLFKAAFISASLVFLLVIAGCTTSDNPIPAVDTANVVVQLQAGGSNYLVDGMTVSIRKVGGWIGGINRSYRSGGYRHHPGHRNRRL